jgi:3-deoxy-manno-octulosonate cytidylyltransferase (CMP-KDO synthetase)
MKAIGIIPARYGSSRFPGKPLADINGKTMIRRVYEQALLSKSLAGVVVATDDERIANEVNKIGGKFMLTRSEHKTGTERCLEALEKMEGAKTGSVYDIVVNIQGDEPFIHPDQIDKVVTCFLHAPQVQIATLVHKIEEPRELQQPSTVKVVRNAGGQALYFSRSPIPYFRENTDKPWTQKHDYLKHIGIYAFRTFVLKALVKLPPSPLEIAESLEQLRWLENGYSIHTELTDKETFSIDTPEDLQKIM